MEETTRLYTRHGIKAIDYEVHLKLQKHCEEVEQMMNHWHDKFKEACQHIKDQAQEHREERSGLERELFEKDQARNCQCSSLSDALAQRVYERDSALEALDSFTFNCIDTNFSFEHLDQARSIRSQFNLNKVGGE